MSKLNRLFSLFVAPLPLLLAACGSDVSSPAGEAVGQVEDYLDYNAVYNPSINLGGLFKQSTSNGCWGEQSQKIGNVPIRVVAPQQAGTYPVLLLSHGINGNNTNQAWLADYLAPRGYIVISMYHPTDGECVNPDVPAPPADNAFGDRSNDVGAILSNLGNIRNSLNSSRGATYNFDSDGAGVKVGFLGYSMGAETGFITGPGDYRYRNGSLVAKPANNGQVRAFFLMAGNLGWFWGQDPLLGLSEDNNNQAKLTKPHFFVTGGQDTAMDSWGMMKLAKAMPSGYVYGTHGYVADHSWYYNNSNSGWLTGLQQLAHAFLDSKIKGNSTALDRLNAATNPSGSFWWRNRGTSDLNTGWISNDNFSGEKVMIPGSPSPFGSQEWGFGFRR